MLRVWWEPTPHCRCSESFPTLASKTLQALDIRTCPWAFPPAALQPGMPFSLTSQFKALSCRNPAWMPAAAHCSGFSRGPRSHSHGLRWDVPQWLQAPTPEEECG